MYIAVCDDQKQDLDALTKMLQQWQHETRSLLRMQTFLSAAEMLDVARKEHFTLYLLDVMMPGIDGITAAREIRSFDEAAEIIFFTSSPGFAYESYGVHATDYLLKPIDSHSIFSALDRMSLRRQQLRDGLTLKCGATIVRIPFSQLAYVEVMSKHLYFNLTDGTTREVAGSLKDFEDLLLCRPEFMRVHRSYIVNMLQVAELSSTCIRTFSGKELPVSRRLFPQLQKDYMNLLFLEREV